jgi:uncharacterized membrane protein YphA (DoxX/SURF4 family)
LLRRFLFTYFIVYLFDDCAPAIPFTGAINAGWTRLWHWCVTGISVGLFGIRIPGSDPGSGDSTLLYLKTLTMAVLSLVIAAVWTALARGRPVSLRTRDLFTTWLRYGLATILIIYGWMKAIPTQMPFPGPDRLVSTFGDASPMGLLWTFMGASPAYQILSGLGEIVGGMLLLWRRTTLLGALLSAGILINVVALNFCYDVPVKLYSSHLLLISIILILPHVRRLSAFLILNLPVPPAELRPIPFARVWVRRSFALAKVTVFLLVAVRPAYVSYQECKSRGILAERKPWEGIYGVESFTRESADVPVSDAAKWLRVGISSYPNGTIQREDGTSQRYKMEIKPKEGTLTISKRGNPTTDILRFSMPDVDTIDIRGTFEGVPTTARLVRQRDYKPFLITRGFHWVNEFPFNR